MDNKLKIGQSNLSPACAVTTLVHWYLFVKSENQIPFVYSTVGRLFYNGPGLGCTATVSVVPAIDGGHSEILLFVRSLAIWITLRAEMSDITM